MKPLWLLIAAQLVWAVTRAFVACLFAVASGLAFSRNTFSFNFSCMIAATALFVAECCDLRWTGSCNSSVACSHLVDESTFIRMPLFENSSGLSPALGPLDVSSFVVEFTWDQNQSTAINISQQNAELVIEYLPATTWLVISVGSPIHPASWSNLTASISNISPRVILSGPSLIATRMSGAPGPEQLRCCLKFYKSNGPLLTQILAAWMF